MSKHLQNLKDDGQLLGFEATFERGEDGSPRVAAKLEFPPEIREINIEVSDDKK